MTSAFETRRGLKCRKAVHTAVLGKVKTRNAKLRGQFLFLTIFDGKDLLE